MEFVQYLHHADQDLTLALNSLHCQFTDSMWLLFSNRKAWIPLYLALAVLLFYRLGWKKALVVIVSVALTVLASDQFANLVKNYVCRLRPMWDQYMIDGGLRRLEGKSGWYGFFSAHAANSFGVAMCVITGLRGGDKSRSYNWLAWVLFIWAAMVSLSRVFVGKHFIGDILVGCAVGLLFGWILGRLAGWLTEKYCVSL